MKGYNGKILWVDLGSCQMYDEVLPEHIYRDFIGGVGLGARIIYERMKPNIDPLGPENILGFMTGPLTGSIAPMAAKFSVVTKSPLTNMWGDANSGGFFGSQLKASGYDAVFFTGRADKPVYLYINNGKAEIRDASHIWGNDTQVNEQRLKQELGDDLKAVCIGPAGESLALIASIHADRGRVAARSGVGAVMGSKKLKAVAVRGNAKAEIANNEFMGKLQHDALSHLKELSNNPSFIKGLADYGTYNGVGALMPLGTSPVKNWTLNGVEAFPDYTKLAGDNILKYQVKKFGCGNCPVNCGGILNVTEGPFTVTGRKPEYEKLGAFGTMLLNSNVESIIKINDICDRYGIDTISAGTALAFAIEAYEKGILNGDDTDGLELNWGNAPVIVAMVEKIGKREGLGDILADGVQKASRRIGRGTEDWAIHIHGQEPAMHDPRFSVNRGLGYLTAATPGHHMRSASAMRLNGEKRIGVDKELQIPQGDNDIDTQGKIQVLGASYSEVFSDSGMCLFALSAGAFYPLVDFISAATGWDFSVSEAIKTGKRTLTLLQAFNIREGATAKNIKLPYRISKPPSTGPFTGSDINFEALRASYFRNINWEEETGIPSLECLEDLGLKELVGKLT